jgi:hypothetical protein
MVDVLEELSRRVRGMRVEFEDLATASRAVTPMPPGAAAEPASQPPAQATVTPATAPRTPHPGW